MKRLLVMCAASSLLVALSSSVSAQDRATREANGLQFPAPPEQGVVFTSRADLEQQMLARWVSLLPPGTDPEDFEKALTNVSFTRLIHAAASSDVDSFLGTLSGAAAVRSSNLVVPPAVGGAGTATNHLVFVPTTPCRIFDTRSATAGIMAASETRGFYTNSPSAGSTSWANQGGDASLCTEVPFDPPAVLITITVANAVGNGNVRAFAFSGSVPTASNLNFQAGVNIANTTAVPTCVVCGPDINIFVSQSTHVLADIVGYFVAKDKTVDMHVMNAPTTSPAVVSGADMGLGFADGSFNAFRTTLYLPEDYSTDTNLSAEFLFSINETGCAIDWTANDPLRLLHSGSGASALTATPSTQDITVPSTANNLFRTVVTVSAASASMAAGDVVTLSWFRSTGGDTCTSTLNLRGARILYD